ncbi:MAG: ATP phosphoribosyltransferase regulatory subunit, partial [Gammaproteobacteria bacterium]
ESKERFDRLREILNGAGIVFEINPHLVRGLDYYSNTVFEWITDELGAQGTVCAGGRYDGLVENLGGKPTPAIGFAIGLERLIELAESGLNIGDANEADIYIIYSESAQTARAMRLSEQLRDADTTWRVICHCGGGSIKSQMKKANRSGAKLALIIGEQEFLDNTVTVKSLRDDRDQTTVTFEQGLSMSRSILSQTQD